MTGFEIGWLLGWLSFGIGFFLGIHAQKGYINKDSVEFEVLFENLSLKAENERLKKLINGDVE